MLTYANSETAVFIKNGVRLSKLFLKVTVRSVLFSFLGIRKNLMFRYQKLHRAVEKIRKRGDLSAGNIKYFMVKDPKFARFTFCRKSTRS